MAIASVVSMLALVVGAAAAPDVPGDTIVLPLDRPARVSLRDEPLPEALEALTAASGVSLAFSPSRLPDVRVTCDCREVRLGDALGRILAGTGLSVTRVGDLVVIRAARAAVGRDGPEPPLEAPGVVEGEVRGAGDRPLAGALIEAPASGHRAVADSAGRFRLDGLPAGAARLRVSSMGHRTETRAVRIDGGDTTSLEVRLSVQAMELAGLVVTGTAGRRERKAQGAAIATIDARATADVAPIARVSDFLQGREPGVSLVQGSGVSGTGQQIRIRGSSSISLSNEPLVYVDGIRADARAIPGGVGGQVVSPLNDLNPLDIERIEIVKGPAAATLYGADASAGVIQIITRKGRKEAPLAQRASLAFALLDPGFTPYTNFGLCGPEQIERDLPACEGLEPGTVISDSPLARSGLPATGSRLQLDWSGRGGGEAYGYYGSLGFQDEVGTFTNNRYRKGTGRLNFDFRPVEGFSLAFGLGVARVDAELPTTGGSSRGWTVGGMAGSPLTLGTAADGWFAAHRTPEAIERIVNRHTAVRLIPGLTLSWTPSTRFVHTLTLGGDISRRDYVSFFPRNDRDWYTRTENLGSIHEERRAFDRFTLQYLGTVDLPMGRGWGSKLSLGSELLGERDDVSFAQGIGLTSNASPSASKAASVSGGQSRVDDRRAGFFAQWEPGLDDWLFLQLGLRADRFAAFGPGAGWFYSPSARTSWVLSDGPFWHGGGAVSSLRLRAGYGTTGRAPLSGASLTTYRPAPYATADGGLGAGVVPLNPGNEALRAEKGVEVEAGVDVGFLSDRLGLEATVYDKRTRDLILLVPQPPSAGFEEDPYRNIGRVRNRGVEVALRGEVLRNDALTWDLSVAFSGLDNEVTDLGEVNPFPTIRFGPVNRVAVGRQVGAFYTHRVLRVDEGRRVAVVSDTLEHVGNLLPAHEGNASTTLRLGRALRLYAHVDWKSDLRIYNATAFYRERVFGVGETWVRRHELLVPREVIERFGPYETESGQPIEAANVLGAYLEPAGFLRLGEVSLTWAAPAALARRVGASEASLTLSGRNVASWSAFSGFDPDVQGEFDAVAGRAAFFDVPPTRQWAVRLAVAF